MTDAAFDETDLPASDSAKILKSADFEILSHARAEVESAEQEAAAIIARAHEDAEKIRADALVDGKREAAKFAAEHCARTARDLDALEPRLVGIVTASLRRILDPIPSEKLIVAAVKRAISEVDLSRGATLIVSPEVLPRVKEQLRAFPIIGAGLDLKGDPVCASDSTILRTEYGDIELDVETQVAALKEGVEAALMEGDR